MPTADGRRPTADGDVVVFHDAHLHAEGASRGVTDAEGVVWETPTDRVLDAEVPDSGETVPLLSAVVDAVPASVTLDVELKNPGTFDVRPGRRCRGRHARLRAVAGDRSSTRRGTSSRTRPTTCDSRRSARARSRPSPGGHRRRCRDAATGLERTDRYDAEAVHPHLSLVDGAFVAAAHDANRRVHAWTVRTPAEAAQALEAGVDGLIADYPVGGKSG